MARPLTIRQDDVMRLEGLAQQLVDMQPCDRPKAESCAYISQQLGIPSKVVREWVRLIRPMTRRSDTADAFFCVYERIASLLSEQLNARLWDMTRPGERDAFRAVTYLLPRVNPEQFDPSVQDSADAVEEDVFSTAGVPQEVFDALTDDERERIAELRATMYAAMEEYEIVIKQAQSRVLTQELGQHQEQQEDTTA